MRIVLACHSLLPFTDLCHLVLISHFIEAMLTLALSTYAHRTQRRNIDINMLWFIIIYCLGLLDPTGNGTSPSPLTLISMLWSISGKGSRQKFTLENSTDTSAP